MDAQSLGGEGEGDGRKAAVLDNNGQQIVPGTLCTLGS